MEVVEIVACVLAIPVLVAPLATLIAWGTSPIPPVHQFAAVDAGAFLAMTLFFGTLYCKIPYEETELKAIRTRRRLCVFGWAYAFSMVTLLSWALYQSGTAQF